MDEKNILVKAVEVKGRLISGEANIGPVMRCDGNIGLYMKMRIPKKGVNHKMLVLAQITIHELLHCAGFTHLTMDEDMRIKKEHYAWAASFKLRKKKDETPEEKQQRLLVQAERMVKKYKKRQASDLTRLRNWKRKLRYHRKRAR